MHGRSDAPLLHAAIASLRLMPLVAWGASLADGFDKSTGQLHPHDQVAIPEDAAGPRHMVFHPSGNFAFILNELQNTVTCCAYSPAEGRLRVLGGSISAIQTDDQHSDTRPPNRGGAAEIEVSPDGSRVWATVRSRGLQQQPVWNNVAFVTGRVLRAWAGEARA